ncbi:MAG: sigma-70 family RNA polymerase sigma factor [Niabella sp.]
MEIERKILYNLQNGDHVAFNSLYWKYSKIIYANVLKLTKDSRIAEDIVQEVFITLWEKRSSINPNKPIQNWIFVVSHNKAIDHLKKNLRACSVKNMDIDIIGNHNEYDFFEKERKLRSIEAAVRNLSPQKKKVFELCKLQGKTYKLAADHLNISTHTVKEYLSEVMKHIRKIVLASN